MHTEEGLMRTAVVDVHQVGQGLVGAGHNSHHVWRLDAELVGARVPRAVEHQQLAARGERRVGPEEGVAEAVVRRGDGRQRRHRREIIRPDVQHPDTVLVEHPHHPERRPRLVPAAGGGRTLISAARWRGEEGGVGGEGGRFCDAAIFFGCPKCASSRSASAIPLSMLSSSPTSACMFIGFAW
jgi:hypothetical protein